MTDAPFERARQHFMDGLAALEAGQLADAQSHFETSLVLLPGRVSTLVNLAATRTRLGRADAALPLLDEALAVAPDDADAWLQRAAALTALRRHADALPALAHVLRLAPDNAVAWLRHGQALQHTDRHDDALASYERALQLSPSLAEAWTNRGNILKHTGRTADAAECFRQALAHGGDAAMNSYHLAALTGQAAPRSPPRQYVEQLFDDYADTFDQHLVVALGYRAHRLLLEPLQAPGRARFKSALDLGCGTGLCGPLIKAVADQVAGIDLSAAMLEKARALGVYDRLEQADLVAHLEQTPMRHDLVVAADVFIYVGALEAVFSGVARVLESGGKFCFSVERAMDDVDFTLEASLRYAHSERYVRRLAVQSGFSVEHLVAQPIRQDQREPIAGLYVHLRGA